MPTAPTHPRPSGLPPVDAVWGGFLPAKTYLLVGHASAGRMRLATTIVRAAADANGRCVLVSPRTPDALVRQANAIGFDLTEAHKQGQVHLLRAPEAPALAQRGDAGLAHALVDLTGLARTQRASHLVVEDFTAFVQFRSFEAFTVAFRRLIADASAAGTTLVLGLGEPANESSRRLLSFLEREVAGTVHVTKSEDGASMLTLVPGTAHAGTVEVVRWATEASVPQPHPTPKPTPTAEPALSERPAPTPEPIFPPVELPDEAGSDGFSRPGNVALYPPDLVVPPPHVPPPAPPADPSETEWTSIVPIDPAEAPFAVDPDHDPFGSDFGSDLFAQGHFVDSKASDPTESGLEANLPPSVSLDETSAAVHAAAYPELFRGAVSAPPPASPTDAFCQALAEAFDRSKPQDFVVLALRMDPGSPHADLFPVITRALDAALGQKGTLYGHATHLRLLALAPNAEPEAAQRLFASIKTELQRTAPDRAGEAMLGVNAMVIPNGKPFETADALMAYALQS